MKSTKRNRFIYYLARGISRLAARFLFKSNVLRNEIKGKKGPFTTQGSRHRETGPG